MKKLNKLLVLGLAGMMALPAVACGGGGLGESKEGTLNICVYAAGYGREWIDDAVRIYQQANPGIEVEVEASPLALSDTKTLLENNNCPYDVVLVGADQYPTFVANGYLEDLSDMYEMTIPDSGKKVSEVVAPGLIDKYSTAEGKIYGITWQENYASGLVYNKKMFERYGWDQDLPETMDEFWAFCDKIVTDTQGAVTPLTYGGGDAWGYLFTNFPQWLMECYGFESYEKFLDFESPAVFEAQEAGRKKIYETIARFTKGTTSSGQQIALPGSEGATAITSQSNFVNGQTAMQVNGPYFLTEMSEYMQLKNFEVGFMPMPHINADKKSMDGTVDTSNVRYSADNGVFAVPASSKNKAEAKNFLVSMLTSESYTSFVKHCNGLRRGLIGIEVDTTQLNDFSKQVYEYFYADGNVQTSYKYSYNRMIENGDIALFMAHDGGYFPRITAHDDYASALAFAQGCYSNEIALVYDRWDGGKNEWKK